MAVTATLQGHHYTVVRNTKGYHYAGNARETYHVTGLPLATIPRVASQALVTKGVPAIGESPDGFPNFVCTNHDVEVSRNSDSATATVVAYYEAIDPIGDWELGAVTSQNTTAFDVTGKTLTVEYQIADAGVAEDFGKEVKEKVKQAVEVDYLNPDFTIRFRRHETTREAARAGIGLVNRDAIWESEPYQWLITNVNVNPVVRGKWYEVVLDFAFKSDGWPPIAYVRDKDGNIPFDVRVPSEPGATANGSLMARVYHEGNFGALKIPSPWEG